MTRQSSLTRNSDDSMFYPENTHCSLQARSIFKSHVGYLRERWRTACVKFFSNTTVEGASLFFRETPEWINGLKKKLPDSRSEKVLSCKRVKYQF